MLAHNARRWLHISRSALRSQKFSKRTPTRHIRTPEELLQQASTVDIDNLHADVDERYDLRFRQPNLSWINQLSKERPHWVNGKDNADNRKFMKDCLIKKYGKVNLEFKWKDFQYGELNVGDLVDLSGNFEKNDLAVVVELPCAAEDPRYTLVNAYGEIQFVSRAKMGLRLPAVFPKEWFHNIVTKEDRANTQTGEEVAPIGKPKYRLEDVVDRNKMFESVAAKSLNWENAPDTYIIPSILAGIISETITRIVVKSWEKLPEVNLKLEILHNVLQCHESPIQLSLHQLYQAVQMTDLNEVNSNFQNSSPTGINNAYKTLLMKISQKLAINNQYNSISLGKPLFGEVDLEKPIDIEDFYAFILGVRKNNKVFVHDSFSKASTYVSVTPLARVVQFDKMVRAFKDNQILYKELADYIDSKLTNQPLHYESIPEYYSDFVELIKLMVGGSIHNNVLESFVFKIIRMLPQYQSVDITGSSIYDVLVQIGEISPNEDPTKWWDTAMIPYSGTSAKADYEQGYYDSITKDNLKEFVNMDHDGFDKTKRVQFDDVIYCIDSANPLEIDDGVSIKYLEGDEYEVSTFVADPSSFLEQENLISQIAFDRSLTLYLPDLEGLSSIPLLPRAFSQEIQLGQFGKPTRVFKVRFKYNVAKKQYSEIPNGIQFGIADKFVKIDYASVNEVLAGEGENHLERIRSQTGIDVTTLRSDLTNLSIVSQKLNEVASLQGRASLFDKINVKKEIEQIQKDENEEIHLTFKDMNNDDHVTRSIKQGTRSEQLVAEIMVMTNHLTAKFLQENEIPAIYKIQPQLAKSPKVEEYCQKILTNSNASFKDLTVFQEYVTKSTIAPFCSRHEFLNIDSYATVTSPLRRFGDLINHWQLQAYLANGDVIFSQEEINYMGLQLKFKDELNTKISKKVIGFFTFKALKRLQKESFSVIVTKKPSENGLVEVMMMDYGVRCVLETSRYALSGKKAEAPTSDRILEIGDIIEDARIKDIDLLDGSILLNSDTL